MPDGALARALERARQDAELGRDELWALYWQAGGRAKRSAVLSYLRGQTEPQLSQYNLLASVLNTALHAVGHPPRLPLLLFEDDSPRCKCPWANDPERRL